MIAHALTGSVAVCSGAMALFAGKGSPRHKIAGRIFTGSILTMGPVIAAGVWFEPGSISSLGIVFVVFIVYLVVSAWSTIRQSERPPGPIDMAAPVVALSISIACLLIGFDAVSNPREDINLPPWQAYFFFATLAFIAMLLDANNLKQGGVRGRHRIVRHVWRMNCALFFATSTLFTGPGSIVFPEFLRGNPVLYIPQFLVAFLTLFWIYRLLFSKRRSYSKQMATALELKDTNNSNTRSELS